MKKHRLHNIIGILIALGIICALVCFPDSPPVAKANSQAGSTVGETTIVFPAVRGDVTTVTPYLFLERWGGTYEGGTGPGDTYNAATGAATTTYADACIRYEQNATTGTWYAEIPSVWPTGSYLAWTRSGDDGSEANDDANLAPPRVIYWHRTHGLKVAIDNIMVGY